MLDKQNVAGKPLAMGLDSGSPAFQLPTALSEVVAQKTGGTLKNAFLTFPCAVVDAKAAIDFKMTDKTTVSIPLLDFVMSKLDNDKTCKLAVQFGGKLPAGQNAPASSCRQFMINLNTLTHLVLHHADLWIGGHFLRRALVVYDPDNSNMYVARGADCGSSLVAIDGNMPTDVVLGKCPEEAPDFGGQGDKSPSPVPPVNAADVQVIAEPRVDKETNV